MRSLKSHSEDLYVKKLKEIDFPDYSNFKDINEAYSDFTENVASVIEEIAPIKEVRVKAIHRTGLMLKLMKKLKGGTNY